MSETTPLPPTKHDHPDVHTMIWTQSELVWIQNRDAQWQAYAQQARADLEAENKRLRDALEKIKATKPLARAMKSEWCPAATGMVRVASAALESKHDF